eukprot:8637420-Pyramimonas_sp.AAC.1
MKLVATFAAAMGPRGWHERLRWSRRLLVLAAEGGSQVRGAVLQRGHASPEIPQGLRGWHE